MTKDEALRLALEFIPSISPAFICEASHHKKHEQHASNEPCPHVAKQKQVYEAIKAALANEALERIAENARELGLDYEPVQKVTLGRNEALRVTAEGEFIWHPEADAMIKHGDFTSNPAMRFILKELRKCQQPATLKAKDEPWESEMRNELIALGFDGQCPESIGITLKRWRDGYASAQRTWVALTTEEREQIQAEIYGKVPHHVALIAAVEARLKDKNR